MATPCDLEKITNEDLQKFLDSFDYVLSDCDGVIWHGKEPFPGAGDFYKRLRELGKKVSFVSNNSIRSREHYAQLFDAAGIKNGIESLTYPSLAIAEHLKRANFKKTVFCVACPETLKTLQSYGFNCKEGPLYGSESYVDFVQYLKDDEDIGAVVFDSDFRVNLPKLYMASTYLRRPDVLYLAGATDKLVPFGKGLLTIGAGQFTDMVSENVDRQPVVLAKPGKPYADFIMSKTGIPDPKRVLFIGDMIAQDVGFGKAAGFITLLVLTSHTRQDMAAASGDLQPDFYAPDLQHVLARLPK